MKIVEKKKMAASKKERKKERRKEGKKERMKVMKRFLKVDK